MLDIKTKYEDNFLKISYVEGISNKLVTIAFSSTSRPGEDVASEEFILHSTKDSNAIFVIDKTNSYGNRIDWQLIQSHVRNLVGNRKARAVGFCMGGFLAIVASKYIEIDSVVSITPQYSIMPEYLSDNSYLLDLYTKNIDEFKVPSLDGYFVDRTRYYIYHASDADDLQQIEYLPKIDNVYVFDFGTAFDHGLPGQLGSRLHSLLLYGWYHEPDMVYNFINEYYEGKIEIA